MKANLVFMFSGQGAQNFHMGEELYRTNPVFRSEMQALDCVVIDTLGMSVIDTIYGTTKKFARPFDQILLTHPALFMVQYSLARSLMEEGLEPDYLLGASLGEWVSIAVAGILGPEQALDIVIKQAVLFDNKCAPGGMLAVLSNRNMFDNNRGLYFGCEFAASNFAKHFCVAGDTASIAGAARNMRKQRIPSEKLPLNQPFHCSLVEPLYSDFLSIFDNVAFAASDVTLLSSASAGPVHRVTKQHIWDVMRKPIDFHRTVQNLSVDPTLSYIDLGPSGTLANFVKYGLQPESYQAIYRVMTPAGHDAANYMQLINELKQTVYLRRA